MQKKIIALAVAGLVSGAAFADTNVTVYGVADVSYDFVKTSGAAANNNTGNYTRVTSNGSLLGFKGSEDLGNGLKALFQFESGVGMDGAGMFNATRDTFAGLSGQYGTITLGTQTLPTRALGVAMDVNAGATGIGNNKAILHDGYDVRAGNSALYTSPTYNGFSGAIAHVSGEAKSMDSDAGTGAQQNPSSWDLGLNYVNGPITAGLTYVTSKQRDTTDYQEKNTRLAGAYNFAQGSVRLLWNQFKATDNLGAASTVAGKQNVWGLGGTFNVTAQGKLIAQYYRAGDVKDAAGVTQQDTGAKLIEIGYEHSLSKRTMIKAIYARVSNDKNTDAYNFETGAVNNVAGFNDIDVSGFQIGIRHSF